MGTLSHCAVGEAPWPKVSSGPKNGCSRRKQPDWRRPGNDLPRARRTVGPNASSSATIARRPRRPHAGRGRGRTPRAARSRPSDRAGPGSRTHLEEGHVVLARGRPDAVARQRLLAADGDPVRPAARIVGDPRQRRLVGVILRGFGAKQASGCASPRGVIGNVSRREPDARRGVHERVSCDRS